MNTLTKNSLRILGLLLIVSLVACSGSSSDNDSGDIIDDDGDPKSPLANGVWLGKVKMDSGEPIGDIVGVFYDGKMMYIDDDDGSAETMVDGTYKVDGDRIFGSALMYEPFEEDSAVGDLNREPEFSFSGTVVEEESISLSFGTEDGESGTIEFTLDPGYNEPSSISFIEGTWVFQDLIITVLDTGEFNGVAASGCIVSGTISILDSEISLYGAVTTIENCEEANGTYDGFSGVNTDDEPNVLTIIGANSETFLTFNLSRPVDLGIPPNFSVDDTSSHTLQVTSLHIDRATRNALPDSSVYAISYADFDQDGDIDFFISPLIYTSQDETPSELYLNDGNNNFTQDSSFFNGSPPGLVHARKAITGDFNDDGRMDVFVVGHGYDQPPFPGEAPYVILSSENGFVLGTGLDTFIGFHHGGASADIDADGDIDVFVTDTSEPFFLVNDGSGNFTKDITRLGGLNNSQLYTSELVDVDKDGYVDLLVGGHEHEEFSTQILWGDSTGFYSVAKSTTLPAVPNYGVMIDIDVADIDLDGDKDIVLNRTGDGAGPLGFYQGYYVQVVENSGNRQFVDKTTEKFATGSNLSEDWSTWFDWIRLQDFDNDGYIDIVVDDAHRNLIWYNDGVGNFQ